MLARKYRLRRSQDFKRVYRQGKSIANRFLVLYYLENGLEHNRVGFSISKKLGKAVRRNYLKRILSQFYQQIDRKIKEGYDMVIIVRHRTREEEFQRIEIAFNDLLGKSGLLLD
ncbi:MAG: ribonuclease P protein component [Halanaerobium sp.]|nr:ribonuclease P protein component [Halanaerobium sp.]